MATFCSGRDARRQSANSRPTLASLALTYLLHAVLYHHMVSYDEEQDPKKSVAWVYSEHRPAPKRYYDHRLCFDVRGSEDLAESRLSTRFQRR